MSVDFTRISDRYDATRGFPPGVAGEVARTLQQASGLHAGAHLVEIGVGTGRIAIPLAQRRFRYTGLDLSRAMMARLREKQPSDARIDLVQANVVRLPLRDGSADGAVAVHVFHLIDGWEQALAELRRVVRPGGILIHGYGGGNANALTRELRRERWHAIVAELGGTAYLRRPGIDYEEVSEALARRLGPPRHMTAARWESQITPRHLLAELRARTWSDSWNLPDAILHESVARLERWALERYGDLDTPHTAPGSFEADIYTL